MDRALPGSARGRLAGFVLRHRRLVAVFWLAVTAAGILLAGPVTGRFSSAPPGVVVRATSLSDLASAGASGSGIGVLAEGLIGGVAALVVLVVVFGSLLALVPLAIAVVSILATFLLIGAVSIVAPVSNLVEFLIALIGLDVAIDYSLLVITRWREERARGLGNEDAVARAVSTAGHSVAFSGLVVAVGLLALVLLPIPFLRSLGYAGLLIPLVSVAVALTLLPVLLASQLSRLPGVYATLVPSGAPWQRADTRVLHVLPIAPTSTPSAKATVAAIRDLAAHVSPPALVTGDGPFEADIVSALYRRFPIILGLVAVLSLLLLTRAFRSLVLSVKALVLNALSVAASYGALVLIWQYGYGSQAIWGIPATGVIVDFVPLLVFAFQFGLSMDYEVFIVSRIREAHDSGPSTDDATIEGIVRTGRLVTSTALILFLAFAALAAGPQTSIKIFATGLGVGILLDATVERTLLLPALISLLGQRNWWLPRPIARLMRCPPTPTRAREPTGTRDGLI